MTANTLSSAANGSLIDLSGNASVTLSGPFNPGGTTQVNGPNVSFSAATMGLGSVSKSFGIDVEELSHRDAEGAVAAVLWQILFRLLIEQCFVSPGCEVVTETAML